MIKVFQRFLGKEHQEFLREDNRSEQLIGLRQECIEALLYDSDNDSFDLMSFKALLFETWQYLIDMVDDVRVDYAYLPLTCVMHILTDSTNYPKGVKQWEYPARIKILQELLAAL